MLSAGRFFLSLLWDQLSFCESSSDFLAAWDSIGNSSFGVAKVAALEENLLVIITEVPAVGSAIVL